ncbi:MAG TPA: molybdate ABC transporter substrate-binding protein [Candidatus Dormibacteraeota bacterium]|nr:molybdate ABC transporter substrate-binding protein [Candidatus Dormibacteraeota bacterium]
MRRRVPALALVVTMALAACSAGATTTPGASASAAASASGASQAPATALTIYAAASLKGALAKATAAYSAPHPGTMFSVSTDSSAALETKIEEGAPADVFLSADTSNPQKLVDKGLAIGSLTKFAGNLLTVVVPASNPAAIRSPADLARSGVKVIAAGDSVPITKYANQLVANLARQPGYPADFAARYVANVASREDNVAGVVAKIALGEGDAGIVYLTDAKASTKVATIPVPTEANVPATYGGVVVSASANEAAGAAFLAWLAGPDGQAVLATFGFLPPA